MTGHRDDLPKAALTQRHDAAAACPWPPRELFRRRLRV